MKELDLNELSKPSAAVIELVKEAGKANDDNVFSLPNSEFNLPLRISSFVSEKDFMTFIKSVEKLIRNSQEYKLWVQYVTENLGHTTCALTKENINECTLEVHHHPINLYTITEAVINNDFLLKKKEFSSFDVATKVIELHFQNKVGYIVLLSDLHKKFHFGFLNIPIELINGNYKYILQNYKINDSEFDRICGYCNVHLEDCKLMWSRDNYPGLKDEYDKRLSEQPEVYQVETSKNFLMAGTENA